MKSFWKILLLIIVNVLVSVGATLATLYYWENIRNAESPYELVTVEEQQPTRTTLAGNDQEQGTSGTEPSQRGSNLPEAATATLEEATAVPQPTATPFVPAIRGALINIPIISNPGNTSSEALRVVNASDGVVTLEGWTLEDADGHTLTFPDIQLLRNGIFIEVYTRSGHDTPYELYWGQTEAIWQSGETAVIKDQLGQIQATYRVP